MPVPPFFLFLCDKGDVPMKYELEIEEDLLAELTDLAKQLNTDVDTLIVACIKSHIIASDVFSGTITHSTTK